MERRLGGPDVGVMRSGLVLAVVGGPIGNGGLVRARRKCQQADTVRVKYVTMAEAIGREDVNRWKQPYIDGVLQAPRGLL
jgi:hypothetical protein